MKKPDRFLSVLGALLFSLGIILGVVLAVISFWSDVEGFFYGFQRLGGQKLRGMDCPVLLTSGEEGRVSVTFKNTSDRAVDLQTRAEISTPLGLRTTNAKLPLAPGERREAAWPVTAADVDLRFFILVKVSAFPTYTLPFREGTCGIMVLPGIRVPGLSGTQLYSLLLGLCLVSLLVGLWMWEKGHAPLEGHARFTSYAMRLMAVLVLASTVAGLAGAWALAGLLLVAAGLLSVVALVYVLSR